MVSDNLEFRQTGILPFKECEIRDSNNKKQLLMLKETILRTKNGNYWSKTNDLA